VSLRFVLAHSGFKFQTRKKLENLRGYTAESIQRLSLLSLRLVFKDLISTYQRLSFFM